MLGKTSKVQVFPGKSIVTYRAVARGDVARDSALNILNQSTEDWYSEVRQNTSGSGASGICVYQCRVVRFREM
jgi:hypothetical protein